MQDLMQLCGYVRIYPAHHLQIRIISMCKSRATMYRFVVIIKSHHNKSPFVYESDEIMTCDNRKLAQLFFLQLSATKV